MATDTAAVHAARVDGLSKTYRYHRKEPGLRGSVRALFRREVRETRAVEDVSFSIQPGEIVGFLGPNGAPGTRRWPPCCACAGSSPSTPCASCP